LTNLVAELTNLPELALEAIEQGITQFLTYLDQATGLDLLPFWTAVEAVISSLTTLFGELNPGGGTFNPVAALETLLNLIVTNSSSLPGTLITDLTGVWGGLDQAFQSIFGSSTNFGLVGSIPAPAVTNVTQSLQPVFDFPDAASVSAAGQWSWDGTEDHTGATGSGSAKVVANGVLQALKGIPGSVQPGQVVAPSAYVMWSGLTTSGSNPIQLQLVPYSQSGSTLVAGTAFEVAQIASPASSGSWTPLTGTYTVPSSGVVAVQLRLVVTGNATAGSVWWDDCTLDVSGGFLSGLQSDTTNIIDSFAPGGTSAEFITGVTNLLALVGLTPSSVGGATNLTTLWTNIVNTFINPLGVIEQSAITGLTSLWGGVFGTTTPTSSTPVQAASVQNVLGGSTLGADLTALATNLFGSATPGVTTGSLQNIADALHQVTYGGAATGTGLDVTSLKTLLGQQPAATVVPPPNPSSSGAIARGASSTGSYAIWTSGHGVSTTVSHTPAAADNFVVVPVIYHSSATTGFSRSVTYGTQGGGPNITLGSLTGPLYMGGAGNGGYFYSEVFGGFIPAGLTGAQTVTLSTSVASPSGVSWFVCGYSNSYSGVVSVGAVASQGAPGNTGSPTSTVASATNDYVVQSFWTWGAASAGLSALTGGTARYTSGSINAVSVVGDYIAMISGDQPGATSITFGATPANGFDPWLGWSVNLIGSTTTPIGSGFTAYTTSTTAVGAGAAGNQLFPNSFYATTGQITSDYTYAPATANQLTVSQAGWYMVTINTGVRSAALANNEMNLLLYQNGSVVRMALGSTQGALYTYSPKYISGSFIVYCNAGDYLQPGYSLDNAVSTPVVGDATGTYATFTVALMNRSLL
jgi:hypothetical protein